MLLHELIIQSANARPDAQALAWANNSIAYDALAEQVLAAASGFVQLGLRHYGRVAVYLDKRLETVVAFFGAAAAGGVFVPVNPLLKPEQVAHILRDCGASILVTSAERAQMLADILPQCTDLTSIVVTEDEATSVDVRTRTVLSWPTLLALSGSSRVHRAIDSDMTAILYTSGSTGKPKGVVLSHRNMVAGAKSVAHYLQNNSADRLLAALPLSFDAGLSQLTTAFSSGATAVLHNYLLPRDVLNVAARESITGLTAVPPLWIQLAQLDWPESVPECIRYIANTGGKLPKTVIQRLRVSLPKTQIFLMYGLTEAFRSTYLPPSEIDKRPDSIGKAIPNAEVLVVREDGTRCSAGEPGELVHRGVLVALGYWNDPEKTAERFRPAPGQDPGLPLPEVAVWSGDTVQMDEEGFLYFVGRRDDMIKTSGYRVSPTEVEEVIYSTGRVAEAVAIGIPHPVLGQVIVVAVTAASGADLDAEELIAESKRRLPTFMVPVKIEIRETLPRSPNGKIDRQQLAREFQEIAHDESAAP
jgi:acyl-CoA ligase (AMP-forming) (exosortase A-associated)